MKYALIIGNDQYSDQKLPRLQTPVEDARELAKILGDKMIGEFYEVEPVINKTTAEIRKAISRFLRNKQHDDLVLLYFSGHGVLDNQGRLHLASNDTETGYLAATAISASFVKDELSQCRSQRQILILDCCHSGAVEHGIKAAITEETFEGGYGRVILTASTETQLALEGNKVLSQTEYSLFTHFLLEGLKTGDADKDNDGIISLEEWYSYAYTEVTSRTHRQTPQILGKRQGELFIAKNSNLKKRLPQDLMQLFESRYPKARFAAVGELSNLLQDAEFAELARISLEKLAKDIDLEVSAEARNVLHRYKNPLILEEHSVSPTNNNQNISDWLLELDRSEQTDQVQNDSVAWLESLEANNNVRPEGPIDTPKDTYQNLPDWLRSLDEDASIQPVNAPTNTEQNIPDWLRGLDGLEQSNREQNGKSKQPEFFIDKNNAKSENIDEEKIAEKKITLDAETPSSIEYESTRITPRWKRLYSSFLKNKTNSRLSESEFLKVFLCHSSGDKPKVRELYEKLYSEKWIQPWFDEQSLLPGIEWDFAIKKAMRESDAIIICLSRSSIKREGYMQKEIRMALDLAIEKPTGTIFIIPVRFDNVIPPHQLVNYQWVNYFGNDQDHNFQSILYSLRKRANSLGMKI